MRPAWAYCAAWLRVAGGNSVLPPWVRFRYPDTMRILSALRDVPCADPSCRYCRTTHDPEGQLRRFFGFDSFRPTPADEDGGSPALRPQRPREAIPPRGRVPADPARRRPDSARPAAPQSAPRRPGSGQQPDDPEKAPAQWRSFAETAQTKPELLAFYALCLGDDAERRGLAAVFAQIAGRAAMRPDEATAYLRRSFAETTCRPALEELAGELTDPAMWLPWAYCAAWSS